jgi:hypothetical protein
LNELLGAALPADECKLLKNMRFQKCEWHCYLPWLGRIRLESKGQVGFLGRLGQVSSLRSQQEDAQRVKIEVSRVYHGVWRHLSWPERVLENSLIVKV